MPPKKKVERAATENISLGPQVREGKQLLPPWDLTISEDLYRGEELTILEQGNSSSVLLAYLLPSTTPLSMSPISRKRLHLQNRNWLPSRHAINRGDGA